mmetsp:Transcript_55767/g.92646  ORF Transcript_55767/g.92646 Transcript_55767/m.92646 type:complete len:506 (+) Transcript_55767:71-1588(+)
MTDATAFLIHSLENLLAEDNNPFADVIIHVGTQKFRCHRVLLALSSDYFKKVFSLERDRTSLRLEEMSPDTWKNVQRFLYTGKIDVTANDARGLLEVANHLGIEALRRVCADVIRARVDTHNCIGLLTLADTYSCTSLRQFCFEFIAKRFSSVAASPGFLDLSLGDIVELLCRDELGAFGEEDVFNAVIRWVRYRDERIKSLNGLLPLIKFPFIGVDFLQDVVEKCDLFRPQDLHQQVMDFLYEAYRYHATPEARRRGNSGSSRVRKRSYGMTFVYMSDFDANGVFFWLGTNFGAEQVWKNPSETPDAPNFVRVQANGVAQGSLVETLNRTPALRDFLTKNEPGAWLRYDLPPGFALRLSHYTLRHGRLAAMRSWSLQGRANVHIDTPPPGHTTDSDGAQVGLDAWVDLDVHVADSSLKDKYHSITFAIVPHSSAAAPTPTGNSNNTESKPNHRVPDDKAQSVVTANNIRTAYCSFRLVLQGPNSDNEHYLNLSGFELYGTIIRT